MRIITEDIMMKIPKHMLTQLTATDFENKSKMEEFYSTHWGITGEFVPMEIIDGPYRNEKVFNYNILFFVAIYLLDVYLKKLHHTLPIFDMKLQMAFGFTLFSHFFSFIIIHLIEFAGLEVGGNKVYTYIHQSVNSRNTSIVLEPGLKMGFYLNTSSMCLEPPFFTPINE